MPEPRSAYLKALPGQFLRMAIYLGIIAAAHFTKFLILSPTLRWTLVSVIVVAAFIPPRFSELAAGIGFLTVAGVAYFAYGSTLLAALCGVFGVLSIFAGLADFRVARYQRIPCKKCGYDLTGHEPGAFCPKCGEGSASPSG